MWNLIKIAQEVSEKKAFKSFTILYIYIAQGQGQITPKLWRYLNSFTSLIIQCKFQPLVLIQHWEIFFFISRYKWMRAQICPYSKKVKGQPTTITIKLGRPWVPSALYQDSASNLSWFLRRFLKALTIYLHGGHLIQWCGTIWTNCQYPFARWPHVKSGENYSRCFREDDI